jgi:hypothetical protein
MAHFAKIGEDKRVIAVLTLNNSDMLNASGVEEELIGQQYLEKHNNWPAHMWIQTSYNTRFGKHKKGGIPFRGNYAAIGYTWDEENKIFWPKKPYNSWIKDIPTATWKSPIGDAPALTEEQITQNTANINIWTYIWNEENQSWNLVDYKVY